MDSDLLDSNTPLFNRVARDRLAANQTIRFTARGASMSPFVRDGDRITVEPVLATDLRIGDIVLFAASADNVVAHRLQGCGGVPGRPLLLVRGDNQVESAHIAPGQVLGRASCVQRGPLNYRPHFWPHRMAALAATRLRRAWRMLSRERKGL